MKVVRHCVCLYERVKHKNSRTGVMSLRTLTGLTAPSWLPPVLPFLPTARLQQALSPAPHSPAWPWALPSWAHLQAHIPSQPWHGLVHRLGLSLVPWPALPQWDGPCPPGPASPQGAPMALREPPAHAASTTL